MLRPSSAVRLTLAVVIVLTTWDSARADQLHVPAEYSTIQEAINAANPALPFPDEVVVADGTYTGVGNTNVFFHKNITVRSENGPDACIINCEGIQGRRGFFFWSETGPLNVDLAVLQGFTIGTSDLTSRAC